MKLCSQLLITLNNRFLLLYVLESHSSMKRRQLYWLIYYFGALSASWQRLKPRAQSNSLSWAVARFWPAYSTSIPYKTQEINRWRVLNERSRSSAIFGNRFVFPEGTSSKVSFKKFKNLPLRGVARECSGCPTACKKQTKSERTKNSRDFRFVDWSLSHGIWVNI